MKLNKLVCVGDAVERLAELTDTTIPEIVEALTGVCFDEEEAGQIKRYHQDESDI